MHAPPTDAFAHGAEPAWQTSPSSHVPVPGSIGRPASEPPPPLAPAAPVEHGLHA
jgi:hypothetical protein